MEPKGFDKIANVYDAIARLVFGNAIRDAQVCFLNDVPPQSKVLILGGGTGWLLARLLELKPMCEVCYIEASKKMLKLSKKKVKHSDRVHFILGTENSIPNDIQFDIVITNFYFDLFTNESLDSVTIKIQAIAKSNALWLVTDFIQGKKWWQSALLKMMYWFFRVICNIEAVELPYWHHSLSKRGLFKKKSRFFCNGFIESTVYSCNSTEH
jgi:tRNA (cmo5U34)-methyltransferase